MAWAVTMTVAAMTIRGVTDNPPTPTPTPDPDPTPTPTPTPGEIVQIEVVPVTNGEERSQEGGTVAGSGTYYTGSIATFTATANEGFNFLGWSYSATGEIVKSANPASFIIEDRTYYGQFVTNA